MLSFGLPSGGTAGLAGYIHLCQRRAAPGRNTDAALLAEYRQLLAEYRQQIDVQHQQIATLQTIIQTLAEQQAPKYDLRGAQFGGGFAETVQGDQTTHSQS